MSFKCHIIFASAFGKPEILWPDPQLDLYLLAITDGFQCVSDATSTPALWIRLRLRLQLRNRLRPDMGKTSTPALWIRLRLRLQLRNRLRPDMG